jgi:hypothetical protein
MSVTNAASGTNVPESAEGKRASRVGTIALLWSGRGRQEIFAQLVRHIHLDRALESVGKVSKALSRPAP